MIKEIIFTNDLSVTPGVKSGGCGLSVSLVETRGVELLLPLLTGV